LPLRCIVRFWVQPFRTDAETAALPRILGLGDTRGERLL
jgi:hypothetical protein